MGGLGSGTWPRKTKKATTGDFGALDIRKLQKDGLLRPGLSLILRWTGTGNAMASIQIKTEPIKLTFSCQRQSASGEWQTTEYPVMLTWTDCHFGGRRAWFLCPNAGCGKRVALLYSGHAGVFACRQCNRLAYVTQRETSGDRALRRVESIRRKLGWPPGILKPDGGKPNGMHLTTFERLTAQHLAFAETSLAELEKFAGQFQSWCSPH